MKKKSSRRSGTIDGLFYTGVKFNRERSIGGLNHIRLVSSEMGHFHIGYVANAMDISKVPSILTDKHIYPVLQDDIALSCLKFIQAHSMGYPTGATVKLHGQTFPLWVLNV